jgi:hypothetical protein
MSIEVYSEKSLVVYGNQTSLKDSFESIGGTFSTLIKHPSGARKPGWIFDKSKMNALKALLDTSSTIIEEKSEETPSNVSGKGITLDTQAFQKIIVDLQRRIEALEGEVGALTKLVTQKETTTISTTYKTNITRPATAAPKATRGKVTKKIESESESEESEEEGGSVLMAMKQSKQLVSKPMPEGKKK